MNARPSLFPCQVELDEYEVANLREGLLTLRQLNCDTGDWLGQILHKLAATEYGANVPMDDQIAHRVILSPAVRGRTAP